MELPLKEELGSRLNVRQKSSIRKARSEQATHIARQPSQERSQERYEKILKATKELLRSSNIEDISIHDIARQANVSPASVNYLFPTTAALRVVLIERYMHDAAEVIAVTLQRLIDEKNPVWQDWLREIGSAVFDFYNKNRHASEIILGPMIHRNPSQAAIAENERVARIFLDSLKQVFIVPEIPDIEKKVTMSMEVVDMLWSRSYMARGSIDEYSRDEALQIQKLYLRSILPETLTLVR